MNEMKQHTYTVHGDGHLTVADHQALAQAIQRAGIPITAAVDVHQDDDDKGWDVQIAWEGEFYTPVTQPRPDAGSHPPFRPWAITSQAK